MVKHAADPLLRLVRTGRQWARRLRARLSRVPYRAIPEKPAYTDAELLARADEFNRSAESHWRSIEAEAAGREHVLNKPFSTVLDTPGILYRVGLILKALEPGVGHVVLDFGAGSCWLSSCLNRMRCRTISLDVSPTALKLGQELFRLDPRHHLDLNPRFLPYDGHRIPLTDDSVDRVVCFDAFHHVPNQDEVLGELYRILKPGGRVVLAEPGEGHAHEDGALYETAMHGVLENDLEIADLAARARRVGFDEVLLKPYPDAGAMTVTAAEYLRLMEGDRGPFPFEALQASLRHFYTVILRKSGGRLDSRSPGVLAARISVAEDCRTLRAEIGAQLRFAARLRNLGDTLWLHQLDPCGGYVTLGSHLFDERRRLLRRGFHRTQLPRDVAPGEEVEVEVLWKLPEQAGRYLIQLDLVDEFVTWFEQCGSRPTEVDVTVSWPDSHRPDRLSALIRQLEPHAKTLVKPGSPVSVRLRLENVGNTLWLAGATGSVGAVFVGGHLLDPSGTVLSQDFFRVPLPRAVAPGEAADLDCAFAAPPVSGRHRVRIELVAEGICWFEQLGDSPFDIDIETSKETPDSREPGLLLAKIHVGDVPQPIGVRPGSSVSVLLRVRNEGNTLWLRSAEPRHGHVAVGGRLRDGLGGLLRPDWFRAPLPHSVAPGTEVEIPCEFHAPEQPGRYRVDLDLVDEGIAWFSSRGSTPVAVELAVGE